MRSTASFSRSVKSKQILPTYLTTQIKTLVAERQNHFIEQVLRLHNKPTVNKCVVTSMATNVIEEKDSGVQLNDEGETGCAVQSLPEKKKEKPKGKRSRNDVSFSSDDNQTPRKKSPNHFIGVQITDPQIHSAAKLIQEGVMKASDVDISSTCIDPIKFHITLMVMCLEGEDETQRAKDALESLSSRLTDKLGTAEVTLEFKGISAFGGGRVLFSPPCPSEGLERFNMVAEEVSSLMRENGIISTDQRAFNPHLTLFKFKNDKILYKKGIRKIKESLYAPFKDGYLGKQTISSLQLCQMSEEKREDGYYIVNKEVPFVKPASSDLC